MTPEVSIVIVTWNSADSISECLTSIREHPPSMSYEVVVVDNASQDDTVQRTLAAHPGVITVTNDTNRGLAAANNQGLALARGACLVISNPDVIYRPGALDQLVACAKRRPRAAFVIAKLRYPDGQLQTSVGDMPTLREAVLGRWALRRLAGRGKRSGFWWDGWPHDEETSVGHGMECCYLVRRQALVDIGPQDERFRLDWEGIEWSRRVHEHGWEIWFAPEAEVIHLGGVSIKQALPRWVVSSNRGMYLYFAAAKPRPYRPVLALVFVLRAAVKLLGLVRRERIYTAGFDPR